MMTLPLNFPLLKTDAESRPEVLCLAGVPAGVGKELLGLASPEKLPTSSLVKGLVMK
jgi:hypothetical protein